jgi:hypothetical protein
MWPWSPDATRRHRRWPTPETSAAAEGDSELLLDTIHHLCTRHHRLINSAMCNSFPPRSSARVYCLSHPHSILVCGIWRPGYHLPVLTAPNVAVPLTPVRPFSRVPPAWAVFVFSRSVLFRRDALVCLRSRSHPLLVRLFTFSYSRTSPGAIRDRRCPPSAEPADSVVSLSLFRFVIYIKALPGMTLRHIRPLVSRQPSSSSTPPVPNVYLYPPVTPLRPRVQC